ncbi:hypothetical protein O181_096103 [Austropuccinia psidii MF-1]|uniref:Uncharacterized protein n=1 Tax=Austropuccinia psidii MF-1 TaxID=1389203 RepID=A0A9Q3J535_9BASI|nr:hypothetical protein [Austropuccinia psidii MF-1]
MISAPPPDHLTPLPCLLSCMNLLLHHPLIISSSKGLHLGQDMLPLPPMHLCNLLSLRFCPPNPLFRTLMIFLQYHPSISSMTHPYASAPLPLIMLMLPPHPHDMPPMLPNHLQPYPYLIFSTAYHAHAPSVLSQYASNTTTPCPPSPLALTMLTLQQHPQHILLMHLPHVCPHPSLCFDTPGSSSLHLTMLTLLH